MPHCCRLPLSSLIQVTGQPWARSWRVVRDERPSWPPPSGHHGQKAIVPSSNPTAMYGGSAGALGVSPACRKTKNTRLSNAEMGRDSAKNMARKEDVRDFACGRVNAAGSVGVRGGEGTDGAPAARVGI